MLLRLCGSYLGLVVVGGSRRRPCDGMKGTPAQNVAGSLCCCEPSAVSPSDSWPKWGLFSTYYLIVSFVTILDITLEYLLGNNPSIVMMYFKVF